MQRLIGFWAPGFILLPSFFLFLSLFSTLTNAQLQFNITDGQVAPTPIAIANFTNENGEISDVGKEIAISLPTSEISPFSFVKLAMAMGVGATCPSVILNCSCALVNVEKRDKKRKKDGRRINPGAQKPINLCISKSFVIVQIYLDQN